MNMLDSPTFQIELWKPLRVKAFAFTRTSSPLRGELLLDYNGRYD